MVFHTSYYFLMCMASRVEISDLVRPQGLNEIAEKIPMRLT